MKRRICYLLLLLEGCCLVALYNFRGLRFLLCCCVCIPLVCFFLLIPMAFCCRVSLESRQQAVTRTEPLRLKVIVEKRGLLPAAGALVCVSWRAPGEKEVKARKRLYGLGRNTREEISFELAAKHCGQARFRVTKAYLFDYLGLFSLPIKKREKNIDVCIYPVITPILKENLALDPWLLGKERDGDLFLRDYMPGDSLHRIYWKLSAKAGEMQIRDFQQSGSVMILLDFSADYRRQGMEWDRYLDMACSLLYFLLEESGGSQASVEAVWRQEGSFLKYDISDAAALQAWIVNFLAEEPQGTFLAQEEIPYLGEALCLREDCRLYFREQWVYG